MGQPAESARRTIANGTVKEMIAVVPNAYTRFQGSFYSNSIVTGNWEDFITNDLVRYIDAHYRTLSSTESRGLAGHSMGGYGTIRIGMKHPEVFGSIYAMSACCLTWGGDFQPTGAVNLKIAAIHTEAALAQADLQTFVTFAQAAAWSPNPDNPPFYVDFPGLANGTSRPEIVAKWSANLPLAFIDQYRKNLERLHAIAFDVGDQDDFAHVPLGAKQLDAVLNEYHIPHTFEEYPGTHTSAIPERIEKKVLPFFLKIWCLGPRKKACLPPGSITRTLATLPLRRSVRSLQSRCRQDECTLRKETVRASGSWRSAGCSTYTREGILLGKYGRR